MQAHEGLHPAIGALDVCAIVWPSEADREPAEAEARSVARSIADELAVPTFLYGALASSPKRRERAFYRKGNLAEKFDHRPPEAPAHPPPAECVMRLVNPSQNPADVLYDICARFDAQSQFADCSQQIIAYPPTVGCDLPVSKRQ